MSSEEQLKEDLLDRVLCPKLVKSPSLLSLVHLDEAQEVQR